MTSREEANQWKRHPVTFKSGTATQDAGVSFRADCIVPLISAKGIMHAF